MVSDLAILCNNEHILSLNIANKSIQNEYQICFLTLAVRTALVSLPLKGLSEIMHSYLINSQFSHQIHIEGYQRYKYLHESYQF